MNSRRANVMISTDPQGQGGVASVVKTMLAQPFATEWQIQHIVSHRAGSKAALLWVFLLAFLRLIFIRLVNKPGIAHIHLASRGSFSRKYWLAKFTYLIGFKIIIHLHGAQFDQFYENECSNQKKRKVQHLFAIANTVVVLGQHWQQWVCSTFSSVKNVRIIYNPGPSQVPQRDIAKNPTLVFLGRLGERKGVSDLLKSLVTVVDKVPDIKMIFGGDGDIEFYQKQAGSLGLSANTEFVGWIGSEAKFQLLTSASLFVLPSYNEGFPVGIIEAMACGIPIVATTVGGIPDAITDGREGLLVSAGDIPALSNAMLQILTDENLAQNLSAQAKQKYQQNFSCEAIMPLWQQLYTEISND